MFRRWVQLAAVCVLTVAMLGADDPGKRYQRVGHMLMCPCGCAEILVECNHVGCPDSDRMTGELRDKLGGGGAVGGGTGDGSGGGFSVGGGGDSDQDVLKWFAAKYGATVLASPIRGGFDRVAWILPFTVFGFATIGVAFLIRVWKLRSVAAMAPVAAMRRGAPIDPLRERIRRETEY